MITYVVPLNAMHQGCQRTLFGFFRGEDREREIRITLLQDGKPCPIPNDALVHFHAKKEDGTVILLSCKVENGDAVVTPSFQVLSAAGTVRCQIVVYDTEERVLFSPEFAIQVEEPVLQDDDVESSSEMMALHRAILRFNSAINELGEVDWHTVKNLTRNADGRLLFDGNIVNPPLICNTFDDLPGPAYPNGLLAYVREAVAGHPSGLYVKDTDWKHLPANGDAVLSVGSNIKLHFIGTNPVIPVSAAGTILLILPGAHGETDYPRTNGIKPPWAAGQMWVSDGRYWLLCSADYWLDVASDGTKTLDGKDVRTVNPTETAKAVEGFSLIAEALGAENVSEGMTDIVEKKHTHPNQTDVLDRLSVDGDRLLLDEREIYTDRIHAVNNLPEIPEDENEPMPEYGDIVYYLDNGFYMFDGEDWKPIADVRLSELSKNVQTMQAKLDKIPVPSEKLVQLLEIGKTYHGLVLRPDFQKVPIYILTKRENFSIGIRLTNGTVIRLTETWNEHGYPELSMSQGGFVGDCVVEKFILDGVEYGEVDLLRAVNGVSNGKLLSALRTFSQMMHESVDAMGDIIHVQDGVQRYGEPIEFGRKYYYEAPDDVDLPMPERRNIEDNKFFSEKDCQLEIYLDCLQDIDLTTETALSYNGQNIDTSEGLHKLILGIYPGSLSTNRFYIGESKLS